MTDRKATPSTGEPVSQRKNSRRRRRLLIIAAVAVAVAGCFLAPSAEEWRLMGDWYVAELDDRGETFSTLHFGWFGRGTQTVIYPRTTEENYFRWTARSGRLTLQQREATSFLDAVRRQWNGKSVYGEGETIEFELSPGRLTYSFPGDPDGDNGGTFYRSEDEARRAAGTAFAAKPPPPPKPSENEFGVQTAAALAGGFVWEVKLRGRETGPLAVLERGPEGVRILAIGGTASSENRRNFVASSTTLGAEGERPPTVRIAFAVNVPGVPRFIDATVQTLAAPRRHDAGTPSGTTLHLAAGQMVRVLIPVPGPPERSLLVAVLPDSAANLEGLVGEWQPELPEQLNEIPPADAARP